MHLLSAQAGAIQQEGEAIDLAQSPGTIVFASSADSELAMLSAAADRSGEAGLRLANTLRLSNNLSVDLWLEQTVCHAQLVVLRLIGGAAYFRHQFTPKLAVAGRGEYLSDRGGLFSGATQRLKEITMTGEYKFAEGFMMRGEYRRFLQLNTLAGQ